MNPERAMGIVAHPDDAEFLAGGTVALWAQNSTAVTYVIVTNGDKGTDDPNLTSEELAAMREAEQRRAAARLPAPPSSPPPATASPSPSCSPWRAWRPTRWRSSGWAPPASPITGWTSSQSC